VNQVEGEGNRSLSASIEPTKKKYKEGHIGGVSALGVCTEAMRTAEQLGRKRAELVNWTRFIG